MRRSLSCCVGENSPAWSSWLRLSPGSSRARPCAGSGCSLQIKKQKMSAKSSLSPRQEQGKTIGIWRYLSTNWTRMAQQQMCFFSSLLETPASIYITHFSFYLLIENHMPHYLQGLPAFFVLSSDAPQIQCFNSVTIWCLLPSAVPCTSISVCSLRAWMFWSTLENWGEIRHSGRLIDTTGLEESYTGIEGVI